MTASILSTLADRSPELDPQASWEERCQQFAADHITDSQKSLTNVATGPDSEVEQEMTLVKNARNTIKMEILRVLGERPEWKDKSQGELEKMIDQKAGIALQAKLNDETPSVLDEYKKLKKKAAAATEDPERRAKIDEHIKRLLYAYAYANILRALTVSAPKKTAPQEEDELDEKSLRVVHTPDEDEFARLIAEEIAQAPKPSGPVIRIESDDVPETAPQAATQSKLEPEAPKKKWYHFGRKKDSAAAKTEAKTMKQAGAEPLKPAQSGTSQEAATEAIRHRTKK